MLRTAYITIFGRGTPADSDCYGLRGFMRSFANASRGDVAAFFAYDDPDLLPRVTQRVRGFQRIILCGHSYGGAAVKWILDRWTPEGNPRADLAIFLDPAPEAAHFHQFFSWQAADANLLNRWHVPLAATRRAICLYQRNSMLIPGVLGVCGVPFVPAPTVSDAICRAGQPPPAYSGRVQNFNVTDWGVHHCHMLGDERVQDLVAGAIHHTLCKEEIA